MEEIDFLDGGGDGDGSSDDAEDAGDKSDAESAAEGAAANTVAICEETGDNVCMTLEQAQQILRQKMTPE